MAQTADAYRWTSERFIRAWERGLFHDEAVELVDGEIRTMTPPGVWHGFTQANLIRLLHDPGVWVTMASLPSGPDSVPDPDAWVLRAGAQPVRWLSPRVAVWRPEDVLLVVEVSDTSVDYDVSTKARAYALAGFAEYWVVSPVMVRVFTQPDARGYCMVHRYYHAHMEVPRPYGGTVAVADLIGG